MICDLGSHKLYLASPPSQPIHQPPCEGAATQSRIFLLEDNPSNAQIMCSYLEYAGYGDIDCDQSIADAEQRLSGCSRDAYSALILDIMLPDGESLGLASDLKSRGFPRVFAYTARSSRADQAVYFQAGFDHVFCKPLALSTFLPQFETLMTARPH